MNRQISNPMMNSALYKLFIHYDDSLINENKSQSYSYLVKFEMSASLAVRRYVCQMNLHPLWKYYLVVQLRKSKAIQLRLFCWLMAMLQDVKEKQRCVKLCEHSSLTTIPPGKYKTHSKYTKIKLQLVALHNTVHNMEPEIRWSIRALRQMLEHLQLEAVFAWLSTLGGAHSALGDYFNRNAEVAWELSMKQLYIAVKIGDPILAAHCKVFMSISLMQRGRFVAASRIIRSVSRSIRGDKRLQERRLINCCKAARKRLRYTQQENKEITHEVHS
ncbi:uncharacterized protein LOC114528441 [Dendronephthya gigantea]|uniref:uncharacterized protein LOC114528441 n=1 Tax=Dendronephthya gigantea TaxID=151771 RepID=UPI00106AB8A4|nr:uncharacterized protein LOC114528441 [Dendronephthya gigantea]